MSIAKGAVIGGAGLLAYLFGKDKIPELQGQTGQGQLQRTLDELARRMERGAQMGPIIVTQKGVSWWWIGLISAGIVAICWKWVWNSKEYFGSIAKQIRGDITDVHDEVRDFRGEQNEHNEQVTHSLDNIQTNQDELSHNMMLSVGVVMERLADISNQTDFLVQTVQAAQGTPQQIEGVHSPQPTYVTDASPSQNTYPPRQPQHRSPVTAAARSSYTNQARVTDVTDEPEYAIQPLSPATAPVQGIASYSGTATPGKANGRIESVQNAGQAAKEKVTGLLGWVGGKVVSTVSSMAN